jgi:CRISPR-associated protein Csm1
MELSDIKKIALAGFLHDIGKFRERGGLELSLNNKNLSKLYKYNSQNKRHLHAAHTIEAIKEMELNIDEKIIKLAASHHLEKKQLNEIEEININDAEIIKKANEYAGRLDREKKDKKNEKFDLLRPLITLSLIHI